MSISTQIGYSGLQLKFEFTDGYELMHKAWSSIEEVPFYYSRSSIKFWGHTGQKIADFDPNWTNPDCTSSLNSPMDLKWCTKLAIVLKMCPIVFRGHPSNFNVTQAEKSTIWILLEQDNAMVTYIACGGRAATLIPKLPNRFDANRTAT